MRDAITVYVLRNADGLVLNVSDSRLHAILEGDFGGDEDAREELCRGNDGPYRGYRIEVREALAAATRVRVTEWYAVVDNTGYVYMDHAERNRTDVEEEAKMLDDANEKAAPHRVVRVALVDTQEGTNDV